MTDLAGRNSRLDGLFRPVDGASVALFRFWFGGIMFWEVCRYFSRGWIDRYYISPTFHFKYLGFQWVDPWPGIGMYVHFAVLGLLCVLITFGYRYRLSATLFFVGFTYVFLLEQSRYLNHLYLVCLLAFVMIFVPAHRTASVDRSRRKAPPASTVPIWSLWLLRFLVGIPYFYGGIAKINVDWLRGEPLLHWTAARADMFLVGPLMAQEWMGYALSYGGLFLDLMVVPALLWRPTRPWAYAATVAFHLLNAWMFNIGIFPWLMIGATTIFFEPGWPRRFLRRAGTAPRLTEAPVVWTPGLRVFVTGLVIFVGAQALVPFRHLLYPGLVHWTEEGHRFSWHMKLRYKDSSARFFVRAPGWEGAEEVRPYDYLTANQFSKMADRPDMILQFCHFLEQEYARMGVSPVRVQALVWTSLNYKPPQWLVDPREDLSQKPWNLWPADWIVPFGEDRGLPMGDSPGPTR